MSNARSPREVCSTTIGTSGLIVLASFASRGGILPDCSNRPSGRHGVEPRSCAGETRSASRRPDLSRAGAGPRLWIVLAGSPQLLPGLGLIDRDRLGLRDEELDRLADRDLLPQAVEP